MKWINVSDLRPINKQMVLIFYKKNKEKVITQGYITDDSIDNATERHTKEFWRSNGYGLTYYDYAHRVIQKLKAKKSKNDVLYWMKLPELPK